MNNIKRIVDFDYPFFLIYFNILMEKIFGCIMRKQKIVLLILIIIFLPIFIKIFTNNIIYTKLNDYIYINNYSIVEEHDIKSAWFRIYLTNENEEIKYEELKYKAFCSSKILAILETKTYNKHNKLINNEINEKSISAEYSAFNNGEIFYNALCN